MDDISYIRVVLALGVVLGLIGLVTVLLRRYGFGGSLSVTPKMRRLAVEETLLLDARHRLVLIRRDDTRHVLVLGPDSCTVVESGVPAALDPAKTPSS